MKTDRQTNRALPGADRIAAKRRRDNVREHCRMLLLLIVGMSWLVLDVGTTACQAQDDFYPLPHRNPSGFGFPYPPPAADEPGVTFNRRYMLDGHPELEFNPRPEDEVWLISTRNIQSVNAPVSNDQFVCKHIQGTGWNQVPLQQLIDVQNRNPARSTVVFLHGNRTPEYWARRRGKQAYQVLFGSNPCKLPPVRFVIWSWPSDPLPQPLQDFQKKMERSALDGLLFGQFLSQLDQRQPLKLVTYSLGTQVAFSGIETVTADTGSCPSIDMIAMAPVTHCEWPVSPWQLELTASRIQRLRFFRNPDDLAIMAYKAYGTLQTKQKFVPGADIISSVHPNVAQVDLGENVGREHNILGYVSQPQVSQTLESFLQR